MPKIKRYTFAVSTEAIKRTFDGFMDMMRYDAARVILSSSTVTILQTEQRPPERNRWASFRMYILVEQEGDYPDITHLTTQAQANLPLPSSLFRKKLGGISYRDKLDS